MAELSDRTVEEIRSRLLRWGQNHYQEFAWRRPGIPPWQALLAEFFLLRTRAAQVEPVFQKLQASYPTPAALAAASEEQLMELMAPLGLRWRTRLLFDLARQLGDLGGQLPDEETELRRLPGVGEYVAAATLALHGERRAVLIDSNIVRLLSRLAGASYDGETRRRSWLRALADRLTPESGYREYGYAVLDHSMSICRPRHPLCGECPLRDLCASADVEVADASNSRAG